MPKSTCRLVFAIFALSALAVARAALAQVDPCARLAELTHAAVLDITFYKQLYPELEGMSDGDARRHWCATGAAQGRQAHPAFWSLDYRDMYLSENADPDAVITDWVSTGRLTGRAGVYAGHSAVFNASDYRALYPGFASDALARSDWLRGGWLRDGGRVGELTFRASEYLELSPLIEQRLRATTCTPVPGAFASLEHCRLRAALKDYVTSGRAKGRPGRVALSPDVFNADFYRGRYADAGASSTAARRHWMSSGLASRRLAHPQFSVTEYAVNHPGGTDETALETVERYVRTGLRAQHRGRLGRADEQACEAGSTGDVNCGWYHLNTAHPRSPIETADVTEVSFTAPDGREVSVKVSPPSTNRTVNFRAIGPSETAFDYLAAAAAAATPGTWLNLPQGTYVVAPPAGKAHWTLQDKTDVVIDGQGSSLIFKAAATGVSLQSVVRFRMSRFTIDYEPLIASLGTIRHVPGGNKRIEVAADYEAHVKSGVHVEAVSPFDHATLTWRRSPAHESFPADGTVSLVEAGGHKYLESSTTTFNAFAADEQVVVRHFPTSVHAVTAGKSSTAGSALNEDVTLDHIKLWSSVGMGFVFSRFTRGLRVAHCDIARRPGQTPPRVISTNADGIHINNIEGDILIEENDFQHQGDDALNLEGAAFQVLESRSTEEGQVQLRTTHRWGNYLVGDTVAIVNAAFILAADAQVTAVNDVVADQVRTTWITLDLTSAPGLSSATARDFTVRNLTRRSNRYVIRNNKFRHNRARGVLAQAPNGWIYNNDIHDTQAVGIQLISDQQDWFEGFSTDNVRVELNRIRRTGWYFLRVPSELALGAISLYTKLSTRQTAPYPGARYVDLLENTIEDTAGPAIFATSVAHLRVHDNIITSANQASPAPEGFGSASGSGALVLHKAFDVSTQNNSIKESGYIEVDALTTARVTGQASSVEDFGGSQGQSGWRYHEAAPATPTVLVPLTWSAAAGRWQGSTNYTYLTQYGGHPTRHVVRTFRAPVSGAYRFTGLLKDNDTGCGDGVTAKLELRGVERWTCTLDGKTSQASCSAYDVALAVSAGEMVSFRLEPRANPDCDSTYFTATASW